MLLGRRALLALVSLALAGSACRISTPIDEQHLSVQRAPASADSSPEETRATLLRTAAADLSCPTKVDVVLTLERRYANTASARYVVEGCGKRALYAETCEAYPSCRYLVLSILAISTEPPPAASPGSPPPPRPPPADAGPLSL